MAVEEANDGTGRPPVSLSLDWLLIVEIVCAISLLSASAAFVSASLNLVEWTSNWSEPTVAFIAIVAALAPAVLHWFRAVREGRTAWLPWSQPRHEHVSGLSVLSLGIVVCLVIGLVVWAADSPEHNREIQQSWGFWVVIGLAAAFLGAAIAPIIPGVMRTIRLYDFFAGIGGLLTALLIRPLGFALSYVDSILVYAVAGGAGAGRRGFFWRYLFLISVIGSCAALGFFLPTPWGFLPLAWGFVVTISVSRRWIWIEEDRERAMMDPRFSHSQARVGFAQNLRDEALVSFMFMFLLVPLVLRQAQLLSEAQGVVLFEYVSNGREHSLYDWIGFYGTELAKAIPFVDWAEIYDVSGRASITASSPLALHIVFATRVLIDLVFLAAFLQALSIASRDASQNNLFYVQRVRRYLDPFTEPRAIRSLVRPAAGGQWEPTEQFLSFPQYDQDRLVELSGSADEQTRAAAQLLIERDQIGNNPHFVLSRQAALPFNADEIDAQIEAVRNAGPARNVYQLDLARRRLLRFTRAYRQRRAIVDLIAEAQRSAEQIQILRSILIGDTSEPRSDTRKIALDKIIEVMSGNDLARRAVQHVAANDGAQRLREEAKKALLNNPEFA